MTPELFLASIVRPTLHVLAWPQPREREVLLVAIAIQESALVHRRQKPRGPARSFFQIETETSNDCLYRCKTVRDFWYSLELRTSVPAIMEYSDLAACAIAAGILWLHPGKLPEVGDREEAWNYYRESWRPGKPRPETWHRAYELALEA